MNEVKRVYFISLIIVLIILFGCTNPTVNEISDPKGDIFNDAPSQQILSRATTDSLPPLPGLVNLALKKTIRSSSYRGPGFEPEKANDSYLDTMWASRIGTTGEWIYIDLGKAYPVQSVKLIWGKDYAARYQIYIAGNAGKWTNVYTGKKATDTEDILTAAKSVNIRYIGLYCLESATGNGYSLREFEIWGIVPPTPTPTVQPKQYTLSFTYTGGPCCDGIINDISYRLPYKIELVEGTYTVYAEPGKCGYVFDKWEDGSTINQRKIDLKADMEIIAHLKPVAPTPTPTPIIPTGIEDFRRQLRQLIKTQYLIDVKSSSVNNLYNVRIYYNPDIPIPTLFGMFTRANFQVMVTNTNSVSILEETFDAYYQGSGLVVDGPTHILGLNQFFTKDTAIRIEAVGLLEDFTLKKAEGTNISFNYGGRPYLIYRELNGTVVLQEEMPDIILDFKARLAKELGNGYIVNVTKSPLTIYPYRYIVTVECILDNVMAGDFFKTTFSITEQNGLLTVIGNSFLPEYAKVDPQPEGLLLYEGMIQWLALYPQHVVADIDPVVLMTKICEVSTEKTGSIFFTDMIPVRFILYRVNGEVILQPIK